MKTTITTCIDCKLKAKAMPIIQNKLKVSLSSILEKELIKIIDADEKEMEESLN